MSNHIDHAIAAWGLGTFSGDELRGTLNPAPKSPDL